MLHFTTYKQDKHTEWVTFVHGAGGSSSIWFRQLRDFRKHFNVLLVDLRGHGKSKKPIYEKLKEYTFDKIGDEVIEVLDHLQIRSTHFVGISLGTIIIREITERYPERTRSMIMGGAVMKLNLRGQILMRLGVLLKSVVPYLLLYRFFAFIIMPRKKHRESRNLFINEAKKLYQKEFKRWFTLVAEVNPLLKWFRIKDAGIPTLYIMGSEDHMFLPSITKLVQDHDSSELFVIPDCGHVVNVERPDVFNNKAIHFLQQLD
ncbi:alpha/beta fold hydrolase [Flavilitoribacter nigricans]|uniref:2-succinyl-6-hydroxy-2, 4-cyclohexadiene-1-carboxylate synthase n=1 Tax=Flavilitoribacter nigricans (strain ATCC 23147 / DSM 23189 / NBRC 102662 / NCIMB 1420 / SS-2) TaxID=1122177 RepID=A0A2D0N429_FLAN2|nr:2-succinyl-6-hydroxy-2,4-cyclohexadiene-1-carboxylate synthase [Flavilitoribacter nigricans DSM 23189 = NBRC 102662]